MFSITTIDQRVFLTKEYKLDGMLITFRDTSREGIPYAVPLYNILRISEIRDE